MRPPHIVIALAIALSSIQFISAQSMAAYSDVSGNFYIYDTDRLVHLDHIKINSFQAAANSVAFVDNTGELKYYARHDLQDLKINNPTFYINTDYYLYYNIANVFSVFNGTKKKLLGYIDQYPFALADSIAAMHDYSSYFYAYWQDNFVELEKYPVKKVVAGDNILAYVNHVDEFKIFFHDQQYTVDTYPPYQIKAGANTVIFIDSYNYLKIFYNGNISELYNVGNFLCTSSQTNPQLQEYCEGEIFVEPHVPLFEAGDDVAAYLDELENFHIFYKGNIILAERQAPAYYEVVDNIVYWIDKNNFLKACYNGTIYTLESYNPATIKADKDIVAYTDIDGKLKAFYKGKTYEISKNIVKDFTLNNTILMYSEIQNVYKFFTFQ